MSMKTAIGLMSGTSMDGVDIALVHSDGESVLKVGPNQFYPFRQTTRDLVLKAIDAAKNITNRDERPGALKEAEEAVTDSHIVAVRAFMQENKLNPDEIDLIGFHGQTVLHRPDDAMTVQLGNGKRLAATTGIDVVYDMRANDMAHGGQGAPLVPVYHRALSAVGNCSVLPVAYVNIGGISNVTYVDDELIAFDAGPGNALVDQWVQLNAGVPYDDGGEIAAKGKIDQALVNKYLENAFFAKAPPKSLDRNDFLPPLLGTIGLEDGARTLSYITASAIMKSVDHFPKAPKLWVLAGGGRHNDTIVNDLKTLAEEIGSQVFKSDEFGRNGDSMEAEAWGYLAIRSLKGLPLTYPKTTGVSKPVSGGVFVKA